MSRAAAAALIALAATPAWPAAVCAVADYNAAVALLHHGATAAGIPRLDEIGRCPAVDAAAQALRDRANWVLGDFYLRRGEGRTAAALLGRVRSSGPHASAALLGLGWAQLVPAGANDGDLLPVPAEGPRPRQPFPSLRAAADGEQAAALRRALVPWGELLGRNPLEPAVQEGLLTVAYAVLHLGDVRQAEERYRDAIVVLARLRQHLRAAEARVAAGALRNWLAEGLRLRDWPARLERAAPRRWWRADLAAVPDDFYLEALLADGSFQMALEGPPEVLERMALVELGRLVRQTERQLADAYLALARLHDFALEDTAP